MLNWVQKLFLNIIKKYVSFDLAKKNEEDTLSPAVAGRKRTLQSGVGRFAARLRGLLKLLASFSNHFVIRQPLFQACDHVFGAQIRWARVIEAFRRRFALNTARRTAFLASRRRRYAIQTTLFTLRNFTLQTISSKQKFDDLDPPNVLLILRSLTIL